MNGQVLRLAEWLIDRACRNLPAEIGDDRYREWTAELPHILLDPGIRFAWRRAVRALLFAADQSRGTRPLRRARVLARARAVLVRQGPAGARDRLVLIGLLSLTGFFGDSVFGLEFGFPVGPVCLLGGWALLRLRGPVCGRLATVTRSLRSRSPLRRLRRPPEGGA